MPAGRPPHPPAVDVQIDREIIRTFYAETPMRELLDFLPHRTEKWIYRTAQQLGVKRVKWLIQQTSRETNAKRNDLWKPHEDAELKRKWEVMGKQTPMTGRNKYAIERRAYQIGATFNKTFKRITKQPIWIYNAPTKQPLGDSHQ